MNVIQVHNMPVHITALSLSAFTWQLFSTFLHVCVCVCACVRVLVRVRVVDNIAEEFLLSSM